MLNKFMAVAAACILSFGSTKVAADTNGSMNAFWNDGMATANVTGPSAFRGQSAGYYTGGNLVYRAPQETTQIASVQMPSVRAGCGGIDIFSGGFSFISAQQFINHMKAIAQAAPGYAFSLALKQLSPMMADEIQRLQDVAQKINAFNMSSCETAQLLVGAAWPKMDLASSQICQDLGTKRGFFADRVSSRHKCNNEGQRDAINGSATGADKELIPSNKNLAWEAIRKNPMLQNDPALSELLMTLTGTFIFRCPSSGTGCSYDYLNAKALDKGVITALLDGGTIKVHACDNYTECLNPAQFQRNVTISANEAMKNRVRDMLVSIVRSIRNRQPLTPQQQNFLGMVSLPVAKMASVYAAHQGVHAEYTMANFADVIAVDLVMTWVDQGIVEVENGTRNLIGIDPVQMTAWREGVANIHGQLQVAQNGLQLKADTLTNIVNSTQQIEQILAAKVGSRMADAVAFSAGLAPK